MATIADRLVGFLLMSVAAAIFGYYTVWVIIMPFVDYDHPVQSLFPARIYALLIPAVAGLVALLILGSLVGIVVVKNSLQSAAKKTS